jgi:hypothetical protein
MPTTLLLVPIIDNVPDLQLLEGETLEYSIGFVDVWRDSQDIEQNEPVAEDEWTKANPVDGAWTVYETLTDEQGVITGYNVARRNLESVEAFRGGWSAQTSLPADLPNDVAAINIITTEAMINTLDDRLSAIDGLYGIWGGDST